MALAFTLTYYGWITQVISGQALAAAVRRFADLLRAELSTTFGTPVALEVLTEMGVPDQIADIKRPPEKTLDGRIALMNPLGFALAHRDAPAVETAAVVRRRIGDGPAGPYYKSQVYCQADTGIEALTQLRGKSFGFGSPQSTSNFLVPACCLLRAGLHPLHSFSRLEFVGGHDRVAKAVYEGRLDGGAGHDGVIIDLAGRPGYSDAEKRLKRVAWSEDIISDPVAMHTADPFVNRGVRAALLALAGRDDPDSAGNAAVFEFWGTREGLEGIDANAYTSLLEYLPPLGLDGADLVRKW